MKKNKFMKLASGLLVLCLMTTCVIGATLAKYVTADTKTDQARVAKWGVRITAAANSAFKTSYDKDESGTGAPALTVVSSNDSEKVVAPGTKGNAVQFTITGTPEVAVRLSFSMTDVKEVKLAAGAYVNTDDATVTLDDDYYPVVFTLNNGSSDIATGKLSDIATFLSTYTVDFAANTNLSTAVATYTLSWAWAFETGASAEDKAKNNKADSILGDLADGVGGITKGGSAIAPEDYSTTVSYNLTITATQID